ncbi:uncharacterized protein [Penaeus vannamei]|uniref:uncharacterized protein n=1 Tax=Penaeus vannamei TaxID=6689 RepID=UPI00387F41EC
MNRNNSLLRPPLASDLPFVATSPRPSVPDIMSEVPGITLRPSTPERESEQTSMRGRSGSVISFDRFSDFEIDDLANLSMNDQRWTLNREKIGLARKTESNEEHRSIENETRDIHLDFICKTFTRKECLRYVKDESRDERCHCGLTSEEHLPIAKLIPRLPYRPKSSQIPGFETVIEDPKGEVKENNSSAPEVVKSDNGTKSMEAGIILSSRRSRVHPISASPLSKSWPLHEVPPPADSKWNPMTHLRELPTNAYGRIVFTNETFGKYLVVLLMLTVFLMVFELLR